MRALAIVHQADAGPGVFAAAATHAGCRLDLWRPADREPAPTQPAAYDAIMTFGGAAHPDQGDAHPWLSDERRLLAECVSQATPVLAVCLGAELLAQASGGSAHRATTPEIGWYPVRMSSAARQDPLVGHLAPSFEALEWHSYASEPAAGAVALASSDTCLQAYRVGESAWGIQFHAEVTLRTFESWLDGYDEDPDAVKLGIDREGLRNQTRREIRDWNRLGYGLCTRFLKIAARRNAGVRPAEPG